MAATELVEIGYVVKTHGVKGQLKISFNENVKELSAGEALFFLIRGEQIPFFIREIEYISNIEALVHLEDIDSIDSAGRFAKKPVSGKADLVETENMEADTFDLTGFRIIDIQMGEVGKVANWYEMNEYILLEMDYLGKEILIPFHEETIIELDEVGKVIHMKIPDGLLEI